MYLDQTFEIFLSQFFLKLCWNTVFYFCHCSTYLFSVQHISSNPQQTLRHSELTRTSEISSPETSLDVIMECHLWNDTNSTRNDGKNLTFVWLMHRKLCSFVATNMNKNLNDIRTGFNCPLCVSLAQSLAQLCPGADRAPPSNSWHSLRTSTP